MRNLLYVSNSRSGHDVRWLRALSSINSEIVGLSRVDFSTVAAFGAYLASPSLQDSIVIAGPLSLAGEIESLGHEVILLSWGFDLQDAKADQLDLERFAAAIVDSTANRKIAEKHGARRVVLIPWGVDLDELQDQTEIADLSEFGVAPSEQVVLSLRAHEEIYRVSDIIEAFALTEIDARLVVGNTGSLTTQLQELALELGVDATFIPAVSEDRVPSLLRRASVYVTASRVDGTSVTLLQAMACGVPVVASANAGNADWVEDGVTGLVFPVGDTRALCHAIERALREGDNVISAAREQVHERANWRHNIQQLKELFESL